MKVPGTKVVYRWITILLILLVATILTGPYLPIIRNYVILKTGGKATAADRLDQYGQVVHQRLLPCFQKANVTYPPKALVLLGLKKEKQLLVYAGDNENNIRLIRSYPILCASGKLGPKLREGDMQVPEGLYQIESLNPNSRFHLSLRVNDPNEFDRQMAREEGRTNLGGDIMIHGSNLSAGCLAMGDPASEDLFVLAAETEIENIRLILSPVDFRTTELLPTRPPGLHG